MFGEITDLSEITLSFVGVYNHADHAGIFQLSAKCLVYGWVSSDGGSYGLFAKQSVEL